MTFNTFITCTGLFLAAHFKDQRKTYTITGGRSTYIWVSGGTYYILKKYYLLTNILHFFILMLQIAFVL